MAPDAISCVCRSYRHAESSDSIPQIGSFEQCVSMNRLKKDSVVLFITLSSTDNFMCSSSVNCVNDSVQFIKKHLLKHQSNLLFFSSYQLLGFRLITNQTYLKETAPVVNLSDRFSLIRDEIVPGANDSLKRSDSTE